MKLLFTSIALATALLAFGQVENFTEFDCNNNSQSVFDIGNAGMPLIVASKGFDCSICINQAPAVAAFANQYAGQIQIWGAMRYLYSQASPACPAVDNWVNNHSWDNVFTFADSDEHWSTIGVPYYYVIHPQTHEYVYQGSNFTNAKNAALGLLTLSASSANKVTESIAAFGANGEITLRINSITSGASTIRIMNIVGQEVITRNVQLIAGANTVRIPYSGNSGIYVLQIQQGIRSEAMKFVFAR